ncbi:zinc finger protein 98-like [Teleopsis dalmanni]|uniref:zinc finger protein 98-like n=1 Tax=Teleopsis dalmanni TaxID=139649 RepID=UPI0018CE4ACC|nr:zinc finger protein 98-like [Teleopsis dalmanni]XP_037952839.1 zinc finger protein 98-like [Teleopsis dalmanni]
MFIGNILQLDFDDNYLLPDSTNDVEYRIDLGNDKVIYVERLNDIGELNQLNDDNILKLDEHNIVDESGELPIIVEEKAAETKRGRKKIDTGPFKCDKCDFECFKKDLLYTHRHRKHKVDALLKCPKCERIFNQIAKYESHLKRPTCDTYPEFTCEYCEKRCIGLANFNIHMRFHKKQYPFVCHLCGKEFMMAVHLRNHIKVKHENQRYCCGYPGCDKLFQTSHALQTHYYSHVGQLPFECEYCKTGFPTKGRLSWHINKRHGFKVEVEQLERMRVCESVVAKKKVVTITHEEMEPDLEEYYLEIDT